MLELPIRRGALLAFWVSLLLAATTCHGDNEAVEVVGIVECADCAQKNIKTSQAFAGLQVTINCKSANGKLKTRGASELDEEGKFKASLPNKIAKDGELKEDCFAQLHSPSGAPCAFHDDEEASKLIFKSKANGKQNFGLTGKLKFSPTTCTSAFLWPFFKHPPLPNWPHWPKPPHLPGRPVEYPPPQPKASPPAPVYKEPLPPPPTLPPPPAPIYHNPPPPQPEASPPAPVYNEPLPPPPTLPPPPAPLYHNPPPPQPEASPPAPVYNEPLPAPPTLPPAPAPIYHNPPPPQPEASPPAPVYNEPPPTPKIPPKYFHHPKIGALPPLPPYSPHPKIGALPPLPPYSPHPKIGALPPLPPYSPHPKIGALPPLPPYSPHP